MNFEDNLKTKKELRFKNGKFRILMFTDIHGRSRFDFRTVKGLEVLTDKHKPDLILLGGDQVCGGNSLPSEQDFRRSFGEIADIFESRNIPWAHVYGNHDREVGLEKEEQQAIYETYEYCVSKSGPKDLSGVGNYMLPIRSTDGEKIVFNVWGFDGHGGARQINGHDIILPNCFGAGDSSDNVKPDQIAWYYNTSVALEKHCGEKVPSIMYSHKPLLEFNLIVRNPKETNMEGAFREPICGGELNYGLFGFAADRGDVVGIYCGHDHLDTFSGTYCGINIGYIGSLGFDVYMHPDYRGCRVIDIEEKDPWHCRTFVDRVIDDETLCAIPGMHDYCI